MLASSETIAPSGSSAPIACATASALSAPVGRVGPRRGLAAARRRAARRRASASASSAAARVVGRAGQHVDLAAVGHEDRSACPDRRRTTPAPSRRRARGGARPRAAHRELGRGSARRSIGGSPAPRSRRVGKVSASSFAPVALRERGRAHQARARAARGRRGTARQARPSAAPWPRARSQRRRPRPLARRACGFGHDAAVEPRHVGGQDQRGDLPRRPLRRRDGLGRVRARLLGPLRRADPAGDVARHGLDVGLELRVVVRVVGRVVADDVHDRDACPCGRCAGSRGRCRGPARGAAAWRPGRPAMRA